MTNREKNLDKAAKEAKVKARREAARAADLADGVSDQDLARLEDEFRRAAGGAAGEDGAAAARAAGAEDEGEGRGSSGDGGICSSSAAEDEVVG